VVIKFILSFTQEAKIIMNLNKDGCKPYSEDSYIQIFWQSFFVLGTLKIFAKWCPIYEPLSSSLDHLTFTLQLSLKASNQGPKAQNQGKFSKVQIMV
jgi:hypothetical protein